MGAGKKVEGLRLHRVSESHWTAAPGRAASRRGGEMAKVKREMALFMNEHGKADQVNNM